VTAGLGFCQRRGGPIEVIRPGDRVFFEAGEMQWHGASPKRFMHHLAPQQVDEQGRAVIWGEHASDEEYHANPAMQRRCRSSYPHEWAAGFVRDDAVNTSKPQ
jgi:hypothetical protein